MGDCKYKYGMASSFFLQFKLEKLRFSCFSKDATVFVPRLNDIFNKSKSPGLLHWATISPPLHCWTAWAKPRSLPRCRWILVVLYDSWFTLGSFRGKGAVSMQKSIGVLTQLNFVLGETEIWKSYTAWKCDLENTGVKVCVYVCLWPTEMLHLCTNLLTHVMFIFSSSCPNLFPVSPSFSSSCLFWKCWSTHVKPESPKPTKESSGEAVRETTE